MTRFELTDKNKFDTIIGLYCYDNEGGTLQEDEKELLRNFEKQIIEDSDKAEELDDLKKRFITTKNIVSTMETVQRNNTKLEQQVKELKEVIELKDRTIKALDNELKETEKLLSMR